MAKKTKQKRTPAPKKKASPKGTPFWKDTKIMATLGVILLLTVVTYLPTLNNGFTEWDDDKYVTKNTAITSFSAENINKMVTEPYVSNYHPLTMISYAMNYAVHGKEAKGYIATNIFLHLVNTVLVFFFIYLLTAKKWEIASFVALFFAVHPMHVESVAWIAERKDVLYTLFFVGGLISYIEYLKVGKMKFYFFTLLLFIGSILSKPAAVVFPLVLLLLHFWYGRTFDKKLILQTIPFFALSLAMGILTIQAQSATAIGDFEKYTILQKIMFASYGLMTYAAKMIAPFHLSAFYPYPEVKKAVPVIYYSAPIIVLAVSALAAWSLKKTKVIVFGLLFYLVTIALVLQFVEVGSAIIADRYTYVPYIGLLLIVGYGIYQLLQHPKMSSKAAQYGVMGVIWLLAMGCSYLSSQRTTVWKNAETMWSDVIEKYPMRVPVSYNNRANFYFKRKEYKKALPDYDAAIKIRPTYDLALFNRGTTYLNLGDSEKAMEGFEAAIEANPKYAKAWHNKAIVFYNAKKYKQAIKAYEKSIEIDPNYIISYYRLGLAYNGAGNYAKAVENYDKYLRYKPNDSQTHNGRGVANQQLGKLQEAIQDFSKAIQVGNKKSKGRYHLNRSKCYYALGQMDKARQDAKAAQGLGFKVDEAYLLSLQ